jgi:pimeloyl-ACP methyl ester carboxylesterase
MAPTTTQLQPRATRETPGGTGAVTSRDGTRIAYERVGSGPNLVLVAGALGAKDISFMRNYVKVLSPHFTVVNYDRRGRGQSTDTKPFAVRREVEDLEALARAVGPSHVFGMSSGAVLALEAAAGGVPMISVIAFEPPYMVGEHRKPAHAEYEARVTALIAEGRRDDALKLFMRTVGVPGWMLAIMRLLPMWKTLRATAHTLPYDAAAMNGFEPPVERLASIRVPALAVFGDRTPQALQDGTRFVAKSIPGAELRSLPKQSHNLKPASILPVLQEFTGRRRGRSQDGR